MRASEMNGLEFLPSATKERMVPCFLLAPWASSNTLERAVERIQRAYRSWPYFLDIDRDYQFTDVESGPQAELLHLLDKANSFTNWASFVREHELIWPCVQSRGLSENEIRAQIETFQEMGRPYCMRIVMERFPANIEDLVAAFAAGGAADFVIILEGGWTKDPLTLAAWFSGVIANSLSAIDANVPTILSCTSMPKLFTNYSGQKPAAVPFTNRALLEQVARGSNRTRLIYGDWGSTRPREPRGHAQRPLPRVDYPTADAWYIARNKENEWGFREAARAIENEHDIWDGGLGIWGEEMIAQTAISPALGIDTPQKNVAARVNIHLHRQAFFDQAPPPPQAFEEDWQD